MFLFTPLATPLKHALSEFSDWICIVDKKSVAGLDSRPATLC